MSGTCSLFGIPVEILESVPPGQVLLVNRETWAQMKACRFTVSTSFLKSLMAAAVSAGYDQIDVRANHDRMVLMRTDPTDLGAVTVYATSAVAPIKRHDLPDSDPGADQMDIDDIDDDGPEPRWLHSIPTGDEAEDLS